MPKRKASEIGDAEASAPRRSSRRVQPFGTLGAGTTKTGQATQNKGREANHAAQEESTVKKADESKAKARSSPKKARKETSAKPNSMAKSKESTDNSSFTKGEPDAKNYWLMKAEPESRFENGTDVKFSIDDLASRKAPEPWDGIRNYVARNNLRAMKKGEMAFFYHSNCKEPGIVGTMEVVQEHTPDLSAHDPKAPYYDASSKVSDPKWSVVHVAFRSKFAQPLGLKELREMSSKSGSPLENMQMLKQSRLSVSRVSAAEWDYLMDVVAERGGQTAHV